MIQDDQMLFGWNPSEPELQRYIEQLYSSLGYQCTNFHTSGASVENGIDILCVSKTEKIGIAVKVKKPDSTDIPQIKKLATNAVDKKVYIYIKDPTRPVMDALVAENIQLIGRDNLHKLFVQHRVSSYVKKHLFYQEVFSNFLEVFLVLASTKNMAPQKINIEDKPQLAQMLDLKDRAISLHKTAKSIASVYKRHINNLNYEEEDTYEFWLAETVSALKYVQEESEKFLSRIKVIEKKYPHILSNLWQIFTGRSLFNSRAEAIAEERLPRDKLFEDFYFHTSSEGYTMFVSALDYVFKYGSDCEQALDFLFEQSIPRAN